MIYIVSVSGGLGSAEAARRAVERFGRDCVIAVFADVKGSGESHFFSYPAIDALLHERFGGESRDTYKFLWQLSYELDIPIHRLDGDDTVYSVQAKRRALAVPNGHGRYCPASKELKRERIVEWIIEQGYRPGTFTIVLGMNWDEEHRVERARQWWSNRMGYDVPIIAPNAEKPYPDNCSTSDWLRSAGISVPSAYADGLSHNNCNRYCVHGGLTHFARVYQTARESYLYFAYMERQWKRYTGSNVTILRDRRGGKSRRLSLFSFIERIEAGNVPKGDYGACGCFVK